MGIPLSIPATVGNIERPLSSPNIPRYYHLEENLLEVRNFLPINFISFKFAYNFKTR